MYVENTLEDSLKAYDRNDAEATVREEDTRDPQKLRGNNAAEYLSKIQDNEYIPPTTHFNGIDSSPFGRSVLSCCSLYNGYYFG